MGVFDDRRGRSKRRASRASSSLSARGCHAELLDHLIGIEAAEQVDVVAGERTCASCMASGSVEGRLVADLLGGFAKVIAGGESSPVRRPSGASSRQQIASAPSCCGGASSAGESTRARLSQHGACGWTIRDGGDDQLGADAPSDVTQAVATESAQPSVATALGAPARTWRMSSPRPGNDLHREHRPGEAGNLGRFITGLTQIASW